MTRNQLAKDIVSKFSADSTFTVDSNGNVTPANQQSVDPNGTVVIQAASSGSAPYSGYICAWRASACRCADIIANLGGEQHMRVTVPATTYSIKSNATTGLVYTVYGTPTENGSGPSQFESTGELRVGH